MNQQNGSISSRVWLITGTSTGFGRAIAERALAAGERVALTARRPETVDDLVRKYSDTAFALRLDVTDPGQVEAAVADTIDRFGRIDVLVNNAGHGVAGALEELADEQIRAVLDTNLMGVLSLTRAVLPHLRKQRSGHIVQLSSVGGVVGNPGHALYNCSKFALEGVSEALAGEVAPLGIRVTIVEPGPFRTDFAGRSLDMRATPIDDYQDSDGRVRSNFVAQNGVQGNDPARAAEAILLAVNTPDFPLRLPLGPEAVNRIRAKLQAQLADLESHAEISLATRYATTDAH